MMQSQKYLPRVLAFFLLSLPFSLASQSSSESVYSDQNFDPANPVWYETPLLWVGLVLIIAIAAVWMMKVRKAPEN